MLDAELEVTLYLVVRDGLEEPWTATVPIDEVYGLPLAVSPWLGGRVRLKGIALLDGRPKQERKAVSVFWRTSNEMPLLQPGSGSMVRRVEWSTDVVYGPRTNAELVGISVRLLRWRNS